MQLPPEEGESGGTSKGKLLLVSMATHSDNDDIIHAVNVIQ